MGFILKDLRGLARKERAIITLGRECNICGKEATHLFGFNDKNNRNGTQILVCEECLNELKTTLTIKDTIEDLTIEILDIARGYRLYGLVTYEEDLRLQTFYTGRAYTAHCCGYVLTGKDIISALIKLRDALLEDEDYQREDINYHVGGMY